MKIIQLKYFKAVCDYGNVSKAADALFVTQPTITIAVKNLEEEFGVRLFKRTSNKLELTKAGEFFLQRAEILLTEADNLSRNMKDIAKQFNTIKAGIPPMIGAFLFSKLILGYKKENSDINFEITEKGSLEVVKDIENGLLDMGIVACTDQDIKPDIEFKELMETELYVAVGENHKFKNKTEIDIRELADEELILFNKGSFQYKHLFDMFDAANIKPTVILNSYQLITINQCLINSDCVAFMYKDVIPYLSKVKGIRLSKPYKVKIGVVYSKNNLLISNVKAFIKYSLNAAKQYQSVE